MLRFEIADPDRPDPALVAKVRDGLEGVDELARCGQWPVDQIQVEIVRPKPFQARVERRQRAVIALVGVPQLGDQVDFVSGYARFGNCPSGLTFVVVHCRGVDVPVAGLQRGADRLFGLSGWNLEYAE